MNGRSKERQELADQALPFEVGIPVLPARGGDALVRKLFEPLGYTVTSTGYPLDATFPVVGRCALPDRHTLAATSGSATCSRTCTS